MTSAEVRRDATSQELVLRVLGQDGSCPLPPRDEVRRKDRLNVYFVAGKVFTASIG